MTEALDTTTPAINQEYSAKIFSNSFSVLMEVFLFCGLSFLFFLTYIGLFEVSVDVLVGSILFAVGTSIFLQYVKGQSIHQNMRNFIFLGVIFWILLDPLQMREGIDNFPYNVIVETLIYVVFFMTTVSLGYLIHPSRKIARLFSKIREPMTDRKVFGTILLLYLAGIGPILYYSHWSLDFFTEILLAGYNWDVDTGWRRGALGDSRDFLVAFLYLFRIATPFLAIWALKRFSLTVWKKLGLLLIVVSSSIIIYFSGSRRIFAFLIMGLYLYLYADIPQKKSGYKRIVFIIIPFILLWLMQLQMQYRASGFYNVKIGTVETRLNHLHRDNNFYWFLTAVDLMPEKYPFTEEMPFLNFIIHPIPRFLWNGKPAIDGYPFVKWDDVGASLTISVLGEFYVAEGVLGIIIAGLFFGYAARNWDQLGCMGTGSIHSLIYYMGGFLFFFIGIRGLNEIITQWYSVIIICVVAHYLGKKQGSTRASRCRE